MVTKNLNSLNIRSFLDEGLKDFLEDFHICFCIWVGNNRFLIRSRIDSYVLAANLKSGIQMLSGPQFFGMLSESVGSTFSVWSRTGGTTSPEGWVTSSYDIFTSIGVSLSRNSSCNVQKHFGMGKLGLISISSSKITQWIKDPCQNKFWWMNFINLLWQQTVSEFVSLLLLSYWSSPQKSRCSGRVELY